MMKLNEYQALAARTINPELTPWQQVQNGCYGMCGEAGECIDLLKKTEFQGHPFNREEFLEELSDVLWYVAQAATGMGVTLDEVGRLNIDKLKKRYPDKFTPGLSIHREEYERRDDGE